MIAARVKRMNATMQLANVFSGALLVIMDCGAVKLVLQVHMARTALRRARIVLTTSVTTPPENVFEVVFGGFMGPCVSVMIVIPKQTKIAKANACSVSSAYASKRVGRALMAALVVTKECLVTNLVQVARSGRTVLKGAASTVLVWKTLVTLPLENVSMVVMKALLG